MTAALDERDNRPLVTSGNDRKPAYGAINQLPSHRARRAWLSALVDRPPLALDVLQ